jgi:hypothetical protein
MRVASILGAGVALLVLLTGCGRVADDPSVAIDSGTIASFDAQSRVDAARPRPQSDACAPERCVVADGAAATTRDVAEPAAVDGSRRDGTAADDAARDGAAANGGRLNWAESFGVTGTTNAVAVALDPSSGDIALTGYVGYGNGSTNLGGGVVTCLGASYAGFLARFDEAGTHEWDQTFPGGLMMPASVAVNGSGDVLLAGTFEFTPDFGGGPVESVGVEGDLVVAEYGSAGNFRWLQHFSPATSMDVGAGLDVAVLSQIVFDASGDIYVLGAPDGNPIDLGCGAIPVGNSEVIAKLDPTGACVWSHPYGPYDYTTQGAQAPIQSMNITVDPAGNVIVAGGFTGTVDFGTGPVVASDNGTGAFDLGGNNAVFVQKLSSDGAVLWAKRFLVGDPGVAGGATSVGADANGDILMGGFSDSSSPMWLQKLDPSGVSLWSKSFACAGGMGLAVDGTGGAVITGTCGSAVDLGGGPLTGALGGLFVAKFSAAGTYEWAYAGGQGQSDWAASQMIAASSTAVVTTGFFQRTLTLAGDTLTSVPANPAMDSFNTYLASFSP